LGNTQEIPQRSNQKIDCTKASPIEYRDDPTLTRSEKVALMDTAFQKSLSHFEACQISKTGGAGASGSAGVGAGSGGGTGGSGGASMASSSMMGTQSEKQAGESEGVQNAAALSGQENTVEIDNGKVPEDIPAAENDSVLGAQIRKAAMMEQDPIIREKLWDEYRKYKGIKKIR
jgi:hypothetical protein